MDLSVRALLENIVQQVESEERLNNSAIIGNIRELSSTTKEDDVEPEQSNLSATKKSYEFHPSYTFMDENTKKSLLNEIPKEPSFRVIQKIPTLLENKRYEKFVQNTRLYIVPFCFINHNYEHPFLSYYMYVQQQKQFDIKGSKRDSDKPPDIQIENGSSKLQNERTEISIKDDVNKDMVTFPHITLNEYNNIFNTDNNDMNDADNELDIKVAGDKYFKYLFGRDIETIGYIRDPGYNEIFIFYDMSKDLKKLHVEDYRKNHKWKWASSGEILHERKVMQYDIYGPILQLFLNNKDLLYVYTEDDIPYSLPVSLYKLTNIELDNNFKAPLKENSVFGPYFKFEKSWKFFKKEQGLHIARYFVFFRYIFMSHTDVENKKDIYIDYYDAVSHKEHILLKSEEQIMFIDCQLNSTVNT